MTCSEELHLRLLVFAQPQVIGKQKRSLRKPHYCRSVSCTALGGCKLAVALHTVHSQLAENYATSPKSENSAQEDSQKPEANRCAKHSPRVHLTLLEAAPPAQPEACVSLRKKFQASKKSRAKCRAKGRGSATPGKALQPSPGTVAAEACSTSLLSCFSSEFALRAQASPLAIRALPNKLSQHGFLLGESESRTFAMYTPLPSGASIHLRHDHSTKVGGGSRHVDKAQGSDPRTQKI